MKRSKILKAIIGIAIFILLLWSIGIQETAAALFSMNPLFIAPVVALSLFRLMISSFNMKLLINPLKKIPFRRFHTFYLSSWVTSLLLPGRIGDFSLSHFLRKEEIKIGESTAAIFLDKLITLLFFTVVSLIGFFLLFVEGILTYAFLLLLAWILIFALFLTRKGRAALRRILTKRYESRFEGFSKRLFFYAQYKKRLIAINAVITVLSWGIETTSALLLFQGFGQHVGFFTLFLIIAMATFVASIPISMNGLGIREGLYVLLLGTQGIASPIVFSVAIVNLAISYAIALGIVVWLMAGGKSPASSNSPSKEQ